MLFRSSNVNANDVRYTALQQAIGETTRRLTNIQALKIFDAERDMVERTIELESAARDKAIQLAGFNFQLDIIVNGNARFRQRDFCGAVASKHMSRCDQALRSGARRREPSLNEQYVGAHEKELQRFGLFTERNDH